MSHEWELLTVKPFFKKGDHSQCKNY